MKRKCKKCGSEKYHAKGLCNRCYLREWRKSKKEAVKIKIGGKVYNFKKIGKSGYSVIVENEKWGSLYVKKKDVGRVLGEEVLKDNVDFRKEGIRKLLRDVDDLRVLDEVYMSLRGKK